MNDLQVRWWPIDRPKDYPKNARKWSQKAVEKVAASIREYGFVQPVVVDKHDVIIIGHLRRTAARDVLNRMSQFPLRPPRCRRTRPKCATT